MLPGQPFRSQPLRMQGKVQEGEPPARPAKATGPPPRWAAPRPGENPKQEKDMKAAAKETMSLMKLRERRSEN